MQTQSFSVHFPDTRSRTLSQDEEYFLLDCNGEKKQIRFHDYGSIYSTPGLYEHLFYERLNCNSPKTIRSLLEEEISKSPIEPSNLSILDIGAGNGMVGEQLAEMGANSIVGIDIIEEAAQATERDRPGIYEDYYVTDLTQLSEEVKKELEAKSFNCLTTVAALGFNDIPPLAFAEGYNLISSPGWVAFNIKEDFLDKKHSSGFSALLREMIDSNILTIQAQRRYQHRLSLDRKPLYYLATVGTKNSDIPRDLVRRFC